MFNESDGKRIGDFLAHKTKVETPAAQYPILVELSCRGCKLDCNECRNCHHGVEYFLLCDLVPKGCVLKVNILKKIS